MRIASASFPELPATILTKYQGVSPVSHTIADVSYTLIRSNEEKARQDGLTLPLQKRELDGSKTGRVWQIDGNPMAQSLARMLGQLAWEKREIAETGCSEAEARERFEKRYGETFL